MNKILFIIENMEGGGAQNFLKILFEHMIKINKFKIDLLCLSKEKKNKIIINNKVNVIYINQKNLLGKYLIVRILNNIVRLILIRKILKKNNYNQVFSLIANTNILFIISSLNLSVKKIICERNNSDKQKLGYFWNKLRTITYNKASIVTYNNLSALENLKRYVEMRKLYYLPNFVKENQFLLSYKVKNKIIAVGRLEDQKNYSFMIRSLKDFFVNYSSVKLYILGDGAQKNQLYKLIKKLRLENNIKLMGYKKNLEKYYRDSDMLLMTSHFEGMSNAVLEAMSFGLPCLISSSFSSNIDFYFKKNKELVYEENNMKNFQEKLHFLYENNEKRSFLGIQSKKYISLHNKISLNNWNNLLDIK